MPFLEDGWKTTVSKYKSKEVPLPKGHDKFTAACKQLDKVWDSADSFEAQYDKFCVAHKAYGKALKETLNTHRGKKNVMPLQDVMKVFTGCKDRADEQLTKSQAAVKQAQDEAKQAQIADDKQNMMVVKGIKVSGTEKKKMPPKSLIYGKKKTIVNQFNDWKGVENDIKRMVGPTANYSMDGAYKIFRDVKTNKDVNNNEAYVKFGVIDGNLVMRIKWPSKIGKNKEHIFDAQILKGFITYAKDYAVLKKDAAALTFENTVAVGGQYAKKYLQPFFNYCRRPDVGLIESLEFYLKTEDTSKLTTKMREELVKTYVFKDAKKSANFSYQQRETALALHNNQQWDQIDFVSLNREIRNILAPAFRSWKDDIA